jgi:hypothetical protein
MTKLYTLLLTLFILTSCTKDGTIVCGQVDGGGVDLYTGNYFLRVDGKKYWTDQKTYESYFINDDICLEDY